MVASIAAQEEIQRGSAGDSNAAIHEAVLRAAHPARGLSWLDIGCGTGDVLRSVRDHWQPDSLTGSDIIDWLASDLRRDVDLIVGSVETVMTDRRYDRVLMVETIEHLEAPWSALRIAARAVAPGGRIVVSTPNVVTLRHRLELLLSGSLTSFRASDLPHLQPALPHVTARILTEENFAVDPPQWAGDDMLPKLAGRTWPPAVTRRWPRLTRISVVLAADRIDR